MRIESKIKVNVGGKVIGGNIPLICLPLIADTSSRLNQEADQILSQNPDLIEWRVDHYERHTAPDSMVAALTSLRARIGKVPLLLTCRNACEGGRCRLPSDRLLNLNIAAVTTKQIDIMDTEMSNGNEFIALLKSECKRSDVKLLLSYHNFDRTPAQNFLVDQLAKAQDLGANIAKIAVMPENPGDVLTLLNAAYIARTQSIDIPIIAISMGPLGGISRIAGGLFGSDVTFAIGQKSSAPGQIPIADLRSHWKMMDLL